MQRKNEVKITGFRLWPRSGNDFVRSLYFIIHITLQRLAATWPQAAASCTQSASACIAGGGVLLFPCSGGGVLRSMTKEGHFTLLVPVRALHSVSWRRRSAFRDQTAISALNTLAAAPPRNAPRRARNTRGRRRRRGCFHRRAPAPAN